MIVHLDIESTGLATTDWPLEIAAIVTDDNLEPLDRFLSLMVPPDRHWQETLSPVVREMHTESGLLDDWNRFAVTEIATVDAAFSEWLKALRCEANPGIPDNELDPIPVGGSGTSHFDLPKMIETHMPLTNAVTTYWSYDIGVIRRWLRGIVGVADSELDEWMWMDGRTPDSPKAHRALADVEAHLAEAQHYRALARAAFRPFPE